MRVVALPKGADPADDPAGFEARLETAEPYAVHRVRLELDRARDRQHAYLRVQEVLDGMPESPERFDAWQLANDRLGLTVQLRGGRARVGAPLSPRLVDAADKLERSALAGVRAHPELKPVLAELGPEHFDSEPNRRLREHLLQPSSDEQDLVSMVAELDARAVAEAIDITTAQELLLRLRERGLRRELASADAEHAKELQAELARVQEAASALT